MSEGGKITVGSILGWLFGVMFLLAGLGMLFMMPLAGILYLCAAAFCLPPVARQMEAKSKIQMSGGARALAAIMCAFAAPFAAMAAAGDSAPAPAAHSAAVAPGTAAPTVAPPPTAKAIEIVDVKTKATESNSVWTKYAWVLTLRNNTPRARVVRAKLKWEDADRFVLDSHTEYKLAVPPNGEKVFNGFELIDAQPAANVAGISVEILNY